MQIFINLLSQSILITFLVIMLMMLIEYINVRTQGQLIKVLQKQKYLQVIMSALLGLIPGCVGIFAVTSLYTHGLLSFGALLAACISTFGDEAFFFFSLMPIKAIFLSLILLILGIVVGCVVNVFYKDKPILVSTDDNHFQIHDADQKQQHQFVKKNRKLTWLRVLVLFVIFSFGMAVGFGWISEDNSIQNIFSLHENHLEHHHDSLSGENIVFLLISFFTFLLVLFSNEHFFSHHLLEHVIKKHFIKIFAWVFGILLLLFILKQHINIEALFDKEYGKYVFLLLAILIGLIPESGPHLVIFFLFLDGIVPFSTLLANSIMQEGHGGLPLIAEKPKKFLFIKTIKAFFALLVGLIGFWFNF